MYKVINYIFLLNKILVNYSDLSYLLRFNRLRYHTHTYLLYTGIANLVLTHTYIERDRTGNSSFYKRGGLQEASGVMKGSYTYTGVACFHTHTAAITKGGGVAATNEDLFFLSYALPNRDIVATFLHSHTHCDFSSGFMRLYEFYSL